MKKKDKKKREKIAHILLLYVLTEEKMLLIYPDLVDRECKIISKDYRITVNQTSALRLLINIKRTGIANRICPEKHMDPR